MPPLFIDKSKAHCYLTTLAKIVEKGVGHGRLLYILYSDD